MMNANSASSNISFINYRALTFKTESSIAQVNYSEKGVRAVFDPDLGPSGGYRCPKGSRYGGYITDRFGRGCGGGVIRRVGRALANAGMRLEDYADRRDQQRRDRAVNRRLKPQKRPGARRERIAQMLERGARRLVEANPADARSFDGGRPRRRNVAEPPRKRVVVEAKPIVKPKRVVKPEAQKPKPAQERSRGPAPVRPPVKQTSRPKTSPKKKPSERSKGSKKERTDFVESVVNSKPKATTESIPKQEVPLVIQIMRRGKDKDEKIQLLDEYIKKVKGRIDKLGELKDPLDENLSTRERQQAENRLEEAREWMEEINRANLAIRELEGENFNTSRFSRMIRQREDAEQRLKLREARSEAYRSPRSRSKPSKPASAEAGSASNKKPLSKDAVIDAIKVKNPRPQVIKPFADIPDSPGVFPVPKNIVNSKITDADSAIAAFNSGADLNDIPEQYWSKVLAANANLRPGNRRVKEVPKNGGMVKQIKIYMFVDDQDKDLGQGLVLQRRQVRPNEAIREVMGQNAMVALGLPAAPARMDGRDQNDPPLDVWGVQPFAWNFAPEGELLEDVFDSDLGLSPSNLARVQEFDPDFDESWEEENNYKLLMLRELEDKAVRERLSGLLFNYALGIADRHGQNGFGRVIRDKDGNLVPYVMPFDMGWFGKDMYGLEDYAEYNFNMDYLIFPDIQELLSGNNLSPEKKQELSNDVIKMYDEFVDRINKLTVNKRDFLATIKQGYDIDNYARLYNWNDVERRQYEFEVDQAAEDLFNTLVEKLEQLEEYRDEFANKMRVRN